MRKQWLCKAWSWPALVAVAGLLAACAAGTVKLPEYVPPSAGDSVRLLIRPTLEPDMAYSLLAYSDAQTCQHAQVVTRGTASKGNTSTSLAADTLATLVYLGTYRKEVCTSYFSFLPKVHHKYMLVAQQSAKGCAVSVFDATDGDNVRPEPSFVKRVKVGGQCTPVEASKRDLPTSSAPAKPKTDQLDDFRALLPGQ
jgi:hypothetical protein